MRVFHDPRDYQIAFLSLFLTLGVWTRDFTVRLDHSIVVVAATLAAQFLLNRYESRGLNTHKPLSLKSAWITALSLCLLLRANSLPTMIIAGVASIFSKRIFRFRSKHFFNPSNFGIIAVLLLTSDAWVTPGQWGEEILYVFVFVATGAMVVKKVGRLDTTGAFFLSYAGLEASRNLWLGWTWDVLLHRVTSGALLLFAFFMITDPRSIPDRRSARILWSFTVGGLAFYLRNYHFMPTAILWALFLLSPFTIVLDMFWPARRFEWRRENTSRAAMPEVAAAAEGGVS